MTATAQASSAPGWGSWPRPTPWPPETICSSALPPVPRPDVIVVDECQFLTEAQIDQLRAIVDLQNIPVLCFGLRTDFQTRLFPGSRRLFELADSITEIKTICACGAKATVNARLDPQGYILTEGEQVELGGNERYLAMCHRCYMTHIREHKKVR